MNLQQIQVLIVDDESLALQESAQKIEMYIPKKQIFCAKNSVETMQILRETQINLVFIDVEMPDTDGFTLAEYIHQTYPKTQFVFLTGHTELGAKSYDYEALDFLTKPLDVFRLKKTFERFQLRSQKTVNMERIAVETVSGYTLLSPDDIWYISRDGRKTRIHGKKESYNVRYSMDEMEAMFEEFNFFRCHQSFLVPLQQVERVCQGEFGKTWYCILKNEEKIPVSRLKYTALREKLEQYGIRFL